VLQEKFDRARVDFRIAGDQWFGQLTMEEDSRRMKSLAKLMGGRELVAELPGTRDHRSSTKKHLSHLRPAPGVWG
jgi:hypothetical protein